MNWITNLFSGLFGGGRNVITDVAEVFIPNAEASEQRAATRYTGAQGQYSAEFTSTGPRGWFNSLIDGLNRLPRPFMAYGTIWLFFNAMTDPVGFGERMQGLALVPDQLWWLFGAIVSFFFGARELHHNRQASYAAPELVGQVVDNIELIRTLEPDSPNVARDDTELKSGAGDNPAVDEWRETSG